MALSAMSVSASRGVSFDMGSSLSSLFNLLGNSNSNTNVSCIAFIGWDLLVEASLKPVWHLSQVIYFYFCIYFMSLTCLLHVSVYFHQKN